MGLGGFPNVYRRFILGPSHGSVGRLNFSSLAVGRRPLAKHGGRSLGELPATKDQRARTVLFFC